MQVYKQWCIQTYSIKAQIIFKNHFLCHLLVMGNKKLRMESQLRFFLGNFQHHHQFIKILNEEKQQWILNLRFFLGGNFRHYHQFIRILNEGKQQCPQLGQVTLMFNI